MKKAFLLVMLLGFAVWSYSQSLTIKGKVTDEQGQSIPGVTVLVVGTTAGTATDLNGNYELKTDGKSLKFSFIGFISQEIPINGRTTIDIVLKEDLKILNEVVVVGYGTQKKKDITTAVSVVGEKELKDRPLFNAAQALQGKAAGVQVVQYSGKPGADLAVRVRGATSVLAGNEPLYVVDGVWASDIKSINTNDIENISILKDASAAAIYGASGANGVVLITTKRGNSELPVIRFNTYFGISKLRKTIEVLNTKQYRDLMNEIAPGSLDPTATDFNNWNDIVFGTGYKQSYQLSASGGTEKTKYYISAGYLSDEGIVNPAKYDRINMKVNLNNEIRRWFKLSTNISLINSKTKDTPDNLSSGRGGVIMSTLNTPPFLNIYKKDGSGWYDPNPFQPSWENPVAYMEGPDQKSIDNQLIGNISADISLLKNLTYKSTFGVDYATHQWDYYLDPFKTNYGRKENGIGRSDKTNYTTWMWENLINYDYAIGLHKFTGLVGSSVREFSANNSYLSGHDFPTDTLVTSLWAANIIDGGTTQWATANASFFGRATYDFNSRYYLTASVRRDGSSKLAKKWDLLPSFSAGWRISSEKFMENLSIIDDLKLRGGWGKVGNEAGFPNYTQYGLFSFYRIKPTSPLSGPAAAFTSYGNPDLRWETTTQSNLGFDLTMFNGRLVFNFDAYIKKTKDLLLNVQLGSSVNIDHILTNAGEIENKGIEFNISTVNIDKKIRWTSDFNMSFNKNKLTKLEYTPVYTFGRIYSNNQDIVRLEEGMPMGSFYGYISEGVDPNTGDIIYKDLNNNGMFDPRDRTYIGDPNPDFTFGFTNNLSYKRFDLNLFIQGSYGNDIFNATRIDLEGMFDSKNQSIAVLNRWTPENTITDIPRAVGGGNVNNVRNSSRFVEDGSYARLKSLTLSYRILDNGSKIKGISKLSVYVTGQNLITLTNYSGFDPEVNAFGNSSVEMGIDYGTYPQARTIIFGINVDF